MVHRAFCLGCMPRTAKGLRVFQRERGASWAIPTYPTQITALDAWACCTLPGMAIELTKCGDIYQVRHAVAGDGWRCSGTVVLFHACTSCCAAGWRDWRQSWKSAREDPSSLRG